MSFRICLPVVLAAGLSAAAGPSFGSLQPEEPININTATVEQLTELPRIGKVTATRIVEWREENGPFSSTEELMNIQGIGERTYERIKPHVTVAEPSQGRTQAGPARPLRSVAA